MVERSGDQHGGHEGSVALVVSADDARAIDAWSAAHHIEDRAEAIHRLVHLALNAEDAGEDLHLR
ncbi:hypothetical protein [Acidisoma sp. C75]